MGTKQLVRNKEIKFHVVPLIKDHPLKYPKDSFQETSSSSIDLLSE